MERKPGGDDEIAGEAGDEEKEQENVNNEEAEEEGSSEEEIDSVEDENGSENVEDEAVIVDIPPVKDEKEVTVSSFSVDNEPSTVTELGQCGDNVFYEYDCVENVLKISGEGEMWNYGEQEDGTYKSVPWSKVVGKIVIEEGVTSVGDYAFRYSYVKEIVWSNTLKIIGDYAFSDCTKLSGSLVLPDGLEEIGDYAFSWCTGLSGSLVLPDEVEKIGEWAFSGCTGLNGSLVLPDGVRKIGEWAFSGCTGLSGSLVIPAGLQEIEDCVFSECCNVKTLAIPDTVKKIGVLAFANCTGLDITDFEIVGVEEIDYEAFVGCTGLKGSLTVKGFKKIHGMAFHQCTGFDKSLILEGDSEGGEIVTVDSVYPVSSFLGNELKFSGDLILKNIQKVDGFGNSNFKGKLILENITEIDTAAFSGCSGFDGKLILSNNLKDIPYHCFYECSGLKGDLIIPDSVESIGMAAFEYLGCDGKLNLGKSIEIINEVAFADCNFDEIPVFPKKLERIERHAFSDSTNIKGEIVIPGNVEYIGDYAFQNCSGIESISIEVNGIGINAFSGCTSIKSIYLDIQEEAKITEYSLPERCEELVIKGSTFKVISSYSDQVQFEYRDLTGDSLFFNVNNIKIEDAVFDGACWRITANNFEIDNSNIYYEEVENNSYLEGWLKVNDDCNGDLIIKNSTVKSAFGDLESSGNIKIENTSWDETSFNNTNYTGKLEIRNCQMADIGVFSNLSCKEVVIVNVNRIKNSRKSFGKFEGDLKLKNVIQIDEYAFANGVFTMETALPETLTHIGEGAFKNCRGLEGDLALPNDVMYIGAHAFEDCYGFSGYVNLGKRVTNIGGAAFKNCTGLKGNLIIPDNVQNVGKSAFENCSNLSGVLVIGKGIGEIAEDTFKGVTRFQTVYLPNTLINIKENNFDGDENSIEVIYGGTEEEWQNNVNIGSNNKALVTPAKIVYSKSVSDVDKGILEGYSFQGKTFIYDGYNAESNAIYLKKDIGVIAPLQRLAENFDVSKLAELEEGTFVTVRFTNSTDTAFGVQEIIPVEAKIGYVTNSSADEIEIDGMKYSFIEESFLYDWYKDKEVLYFMNNESVVDISVPEVVCGYVEAIDDHGITINNRTYAIGNFSSIEKLPQVNTYCRVYVAFGIYLKSDNYETKTGVLESFIKTAGTNAQIIVDGISYIGDLNLEDDSEIKAGEEVYFLLKDGIVVDMHHINKLLSGGKLKVRSESTIGTLSYYEGLLLGGSWTPEKFEIQVSVSYVFDFNLREEYDLDVLKKNKTVLAAINKSYVIKNISVESGGKLQTENEENIFNDVMYESKDIFSTNVVMSPLNSYKPNVANEDIPVIIKVEAVIGDTPVTLTENFNITVYNRTIQEKQAKEQEKERKKEAQEKNYIEGSAIEINDYTKGIVLPPNLEALLKDDATRESLKNMLVFYFASLTIEGEEEITAEDVCEEVKSIFSTAYKYGLEKTFGTDIITKSFETATKVNVKNWTLKGIKGSIPVQVEMQVDGKVRNKTIQINYSGIGNGISSSSSSWLTISWEPMEGEKSEELIREANGDTKGTVTLASVNQFAEDMKAAAVNAINECYKVLFKDSVKEIGGFLVDNVYAKILEKYSCKIQKGVFNIMTGTAKKFTINCPVDVYVYDLSGNLDGSIIGDEVTIYDDSIEMYKEREAKIVTTIGDDYDIKLVGTDYGNMEYEIKELSSTGEIIRTVLYTELPLIPDIEYIGKLPKQTFVETTDYDLKKSDGTSAIAVYDSYIPEMVKESEKDDTFPSIENIEVLTDVDNKMTVQATVVDEGENISVVNVIVVVNGEASLLPMTCKKESIWYTVVEDCSDIPGSKLYVIVMDESGNLVESEVMKIYKEKLPVPTANRKTESVLDGGTEVVLNCIESGAKIYYTVDETNPTAESTLYTAPIVLTESTTIKAIAVKEGYRNSDVAVFAYTIVEEEKVTFTVTFNSNGGSEVSTQVVGENQKAKVPEEPTRRGYIFKGWYFRDKLYDFEKPVVADIILEARWEIDESQKKGDVLPEDLPTNNIIPDGIWSAGIVDKTYTASAIQQDFRVYDGTKLLKEKTDYTISYKNNKNAYTYSDEDYAAFEENLKNTGKKVKTGTFDPAKAPQVTIKMKGNYTGSKTFYFEIEQADISGVGFETADLTVTYTGKKQTPKPTLTWNGKALKYDTDFYVPEYDNAKNDKTVFTEPQSEPYQLTIAGKKNFTGEIPITLTISNSTKQIAMSKVTVKGITNQKWTGEQITQTGFKVSYGKDILTEENGDYTISWGVNRAVGTGTVTFTGTGQDSDGDGFSYIGTKTVTFKITGTAMSKVTVTGVEKSYPFTGTAVEPAASLSYKADKKAEEVPLTEGIHYTVSYQKNVDKGTATIVFTGMESGGYTGTKKYTFKITAAGVSDVVNGDTVTEQVQVTFKDAENVQDGVYIASHMKGGARPEVIVTSGDITLEPNKDYTISYANNKKPARSTDEKAPSITVKGKGNFTGSKKVYFTIEPKALTNENGIKVVANDKVVSNKQNGYRQSFRIYDSDGKALGSADYDAGKAVYTLIATQNADGTVKEENRILDKKSTAPANSTIRITVQGKGNYAGGEVYATYRILESSHDISKATIQIRNQDYTGQPVLITEQSQFKQGKVYIKIGKETKELILGEDIRVVLGSYEKNVNKGVAKVTFCGINDFGGTKTVSYKIGARSIEEFWNGIQARMARLFGQ